MDRIELPPDPESVATARHFVTETLGDQVEDRFALALMTSELVTNVIRHTTSEITVAVGSGPPHRVEVRDGVAATDAFRKMVLAPFRDADPTEPGGHGLGIVHELAERVGLDEDPEGGKIVWFEI